MLLILLLICADLRLFQTLVNAEDNFKSSRPVENKRHANAHQPSPPSQQQRLQSPLSAIAKTLNVYAGSRALLALCSVFDRDMLVLLAKENPPSMPLAFPQPRAIMSQRYAPSCA
jgi:hypothetical protein